MKINRLGKTIVALGLTVSVPLAGVVEAQAGIAAWLWDAGVLLKDANPEVWAAGVIGASAVAAGIYGYAKLSGNDYMLRYSNVVAKAAWTWATGLPADVLAHFQGASATTSGSIALDSTAAGALQNFYNQQMYEQGTGYLQSGNTVIISQPSSYTTSGGATYQVVAGTPSDRWNQTAYMTGKGYTFVADGDYSNVSQKSWWGSTAPWTFWVDDLGRLEAQGKPGQVIHHYTYFDIGAYSAPYSPSETDITLNSLGQAPIGVGVQFTYTVEADAGFQGSPASTVAYPADKYGTGSTVYVPPVTTTGAGTVALPTPVPIPGTNDVGLTSDGTTAVDSQTGTATDVSTATSEGTLTGILGAITGFFDLSKPVDWSPIRDLAVSTKFPFSLPWDLDAGLKSLQATGVSPSWDVKFPDGMGGSVAEHISLDSGWNTVALVLRDGLLIVFNVALVWGVVKLMGA